MATYKILTLGDSVMWGQGLQQGHKFAQLVANRIAGLGRTVELAALPHSGAVVCTGPTPPSRFTSFLYGELPRSFPSISSQLGIAAQTPGFADFLKPGDGDLPSWRDTKLALQHAIAGYSGPAGRPPDLILVDGGINDIGALQIAIPWDLDSPDPCAGAGAAAPGGAVAQVNSQLATSGGDVGALDLTQIQTISDAKLKQLIDKYVFDRMRPLVGRLAQVFPTSKVVVTGYFPIFTSGSVEGLKAHPSAAVLVAHRYDEDQMRAALSLALHPAAAGDAFANRVVAQSALWYQFSTQRLQAIVDEANAAHGHRFALASPVFGPDNGALAPHAFLWSFSTVIDEVIRKILALLGGGAPAAVAPAALAAAAPAAVLSLFGDASQAAAFLLGLELGRQLATDEVIDARAAAATEYYVHSATGHADPETTFVNGLKTGFASIGHPNQQGAQAYLAAITPFLP